MRKKGRICSKASYICQKLENIDKINQEITESLRVLKDLDQKISTVTNSNEIFQDKKKFLESLREEVNQVNTNNHEVYIQKVEVLNRIEGFILLETTIYLRQIKKCLDRDKQYAQQFPFPKNTKIYESKKSGLYRIADGFSDLPKGNLYIKNRVQHIREYINEVSGILSARAKNNQTIISDLGHLQRIQKEIELVDFSLTFTETLRLFNEIRRRIGAIDNCNTRIITKKMEVRHLLQYLEDTIYEKNDLAPFKELKSLLNEHEKVAQQFIHPVDSVIYQEKKREIYKILRRITLRVVQSNINRELLDSLSETCKIVLELLTKSAQEVENKNDGIKNLNLIIDQISQVAALNTSCERKATLLGKLSEKILKLKMHPKLPDEILNILRDVDSKTECEISKVRLIFINERIEILKKKIIDLERPYPTNTFTEKINEIFYLKDTIDDMPEGNVELDTHKSQLLQELNSIFYILDENLAKAVAGRKESEKILELQDHFTDFSSEALAVEKNSIEFIQMIYQRAQSFEDNIKHYLGSSDSVDYYVMHENLLRLLEELDKLTCENNEELLTEIVKTITYIKGLIECLKSSTCGQ